MSGKRYSMRFAVLVLSALTFWTLLGLQQGTAPRSGQGDGSLFVRASLATSPQAAIRLGKDAPREHRDLFSLPALTPGWSSLGSTRSLGLLSLLDAGPPGPGDIRTRAPPLQSS